jgi:alkylation response protein AidB-like acyl-CoA dehydrogenase
MPSSTCAPRWSRSWRSSARWSGTQPTPSAKCPSESSLYAAHAKALLGDAGRFVARTATEVHGGMGITDEPGLHHWFKRFGVNRQLYGGPEQARRHAAALQGAA